MGSGYVGFRRGAVVSVRAAVFEAVVLPPEVSFL